MHTNEGSTGIADLILQGDNPPDLDRNALRMMVTRTLNNKGEDGRKGNGREPWKVLTRWEMSDEISKREHEYSLRNGWRRLTNMKSSPQNKA